MHIVANRSPQIALRSAAPSVVGRHISWRRSWSGFLALLGREGRLTMRTNRSSMRGALLRSIGAVAVAGLLVPSLTSRHSPARAQSRPAAAAIAVDTKMTAPMWAMLERRVLEESAPAMEEFYRKYYDDRGYVQCVLRWGADDGPDDAFENFAGWPEFHALGGGDAILRLYIKGLDGMIQQYTDAKTTEVPAGRGGMYYKEFSAQSDWMHHGEGLRVFNRMGLSVPGDAKYLERARRFAGLYMGEDPEAPNYDPRRKLIRSLINGSRGPMLRKATSLDWVGDPFDVQNFSLVHSERNFEEMLAHYEEYGDVIGDSFLNLVATTLPLNAYLATGDAKYKKWIVDYMTPGWTA